MTDPEKRKLLLQEIEEIPDNLLSEVYEFLNYLKYKRTVDEEKEGILRVTEKVLAKDWDLPEEDEAWRDL